MPTVPVSVACQPPGAAFDVPELLLAQAFAASCALRTVVEIHPTERDAGEEVIALYPDNGSACHCRIWRDATAVIIQAMPGRPQHFACLSDALDWLKPEEPVLASDMVLAIPPTSRAFPPCQ